MGDADAQFGAPLAQRFQRVTATGRRRGTFIVLEGLDGAGTTTQSARLADWLNEQGVKTVCTREPTDSKFGVELKEQLSVIAAQNPMATALAFAYDRMSHLFDPDGISNTLGAGISVICDRYELSSLAYQSVSGVDMEWLLAVNAPAIAPDFTIFLDVPPEICVTRITARGDAGDAFHALDFLHRVDVSYREAMSASRKLGQLFHIEGTADELAVHQAIVDRIVGAL